MVIHMLIYTQMTIRAHQIPVSQLKKCMVSLQLLRFNYELVIILLIKFVEFSSIVASFTRQRKIVDNLLVNANECDYDANLNEMLYEDYLSDSSIAWTTKILL